MPVSPLSSCKHRYHSNGCARSKVWVMLTRTPLSRSWSLLRSIDAWMLRCWSITNTPPRETAFDAPEIQSA